MNLRSGRTLSVRNRSIAPRPNTVADIIEAPTGSAPPQARPEATPSHRTEDTSWNRDFGSSEARDVMDGWIAWAAGQGREQDAERGEVQTPEQIALEERQGREYAARRAAELSSGAALLARRREEERRLEEQRQEELVRLERESARQRRIRDREACLSAMCLDCSSRTAKCCSCSWCELVVLAVAVLCGLIIGILAGEYLCRCFC